MSDPRPRVVPDEEAVERGAKAAMRWGFAADEVGEPTDAIRALARSVLEAASPSSSFESLKADLEQLEQSFAAWREDAKRIQRAAEGEKQAAEGEVRRLRADLERVVEERDRYREALEFYAKSMGGRRARSVLAQLPEPERTRERSET